MHSKDSKLLIFVPSEEEFRCTNLPFVILCKIAEAFIKSKQKFSKVIAPTKCEACFLSTKRNLFQFAKKSKFNPVQKSDC